jgi:L-ascorbate metabolism protein UlaG (beta-lactamase superfamily)
MRTAVLWLVLLSIATTFQPAAAGEDPGVLEFTFVGNESFLVTDGEFTMAMDFPYRSGSSGYMQYDFEKTRPRGVVVCLVTHSHYDHFDFVIFRHHSWALIGPPSVTYGKVDYDITTIESDDPVMWESIMIEPHATPHANLDHYSYLVTWRGVRMYMAGDTEITGPILAAKDLDVAFVTPWLLDGLREQGEKVDAKRIIVYHHRHREMVEPYQDCVVPEQGDTFEIPFRESSAE